MHASAPNARDAKGFLAFRLDESGRAFYSVDRVQKDRSSSLRQHPEYMHIKSNSLELQKILSNRELTWVDSKRDALQGCRGVPR